MLNIEVKNQVLETATTDFVTGSNTVHVRAALLRSGRPPRPAPNLLLELRWLTADRGGSPAPTTLRRRKWITRSNGPGECYGPELRNLSGCRERESRRAGGPVCPVTRRATGNGTCGAASQQRPTSDLRATRRRNGSETETDSDFPLALDRWRICRFQAPLGKPSLAIAKKRRTICRTGAELHRALMGGFAATF